MKYINTKEASENWSISDRRIRVLCQDGRIDGAVKIGRYWSIPYDAVKPIDAREGIEKEYSGLSYDFSYIDSLKNTIDSFQHLSKNLKDSLHEKFIVECTYNSNALEGNTLTMSDTKVVLGGITVGGKSMSEHVGIINHREAILFVDEMFLDKKPITELFIKNLHAFLLKEIDNKNAGKYRVENIADNSSNYVYPKYQDVNNLMQKLITEYQKNWLDYHPVVRAALLHGEFLRINPFLDGNGKIARLLLNFELMRNEYTPIIIKSEDKDEYYDAIDVVKIEQDYEPFTKLLASRLIEAERIRLLVSG